MSFLKKTREFINQHYKTPKGIIGTYIGEKMVRQHKTETNWTLELMNVQKGDRILELGCGAGYAIKLLLEKDLTQEMVGLDISPTIIRSAQFRNKKAIKEKRSKLVQANLNNLPFDHDYFNTVFMASTGTPLQNTIEELYALMEWVQPGLLGNITNFRKKHIVYASKFGRRFVPIGPKRLGELRRTISPYMLRRLKKDVAKDLPPMIFHRRDVEMSPNNLPSMKNPN